MSVYSSWIHGNALVLESPLNFGPNGEQNGRLNVTPFGWGADVSLEGLPTRSWAHLPIPTTNSPGFELVRVFLLFKCSNATVSQIHIYDGGKGPIAEFNNLTLEGPFLTKSSSNTFELEEPYQMKGGVGLSFYFVTSIGGPTAANLVVCAAGAEFRKRNIFDILLSPFRRGP